MEGIKVQEGIKNGDEKEICFYLKEIVFVFVLKDGMYTERFFKDLYYYLICFLSESLTSDS